MLHSFLLSNLKIVAKLYNYLYYSKSYAKYTHYNTESIKYLCFT